MGERGVSTLKWAKISHIDRVVSPSLRGEQWVFIPVVPEAFPIQGSSAEGGGRTRASPLTTFRNDHMSGRRGETPII